LQAAAIDGLGGVEISLRINGKSMQQSEVAGVVPRAAEAAEKGCVTQLVERSDDVLPACKTLAEKLLQLPSGGLSAIKQAIWGASGPKMIRCDAREARLYRKCLVLSKTEARRKL